MTGRLAKLVLTLVLLTLLTTPAHATVIDFQTFDFTEFNLFAAWAVPLANVLATLND